MTRDGCYLQSRVGPLVVSVLLMLVGGCATTGGSARDEAANGPTAQETLASGDAAARAGDFQRALVHYLHAVGIEETAEGWLRVGAASTRLEQPERALQAYRKVVELDPLHAEAREEVGLALVARGDGVAAREHLTVAVELEPRRWRSHNALGVLADLEKDHNAAMSHYQSALALKPDSPMLLNNLGYSKFLAGDLEGAARDFYAAGQIDASYKPAWSNLGMVYAHQGWYADAVQVLTRVGDRAAAYNDVGYIASERGDLAESEELLSEAIRLSPVYYEVAYRNLALVRNKMRSQPQPARVSEASSSGSRLRTAGTGF